MKEPKKIEDWKETIREDVKGKRGAWRLLPREIFNSDAYNELSHAERSMLLTALNQISYEDSSKKRKRKVDSRKVLRNGGRLYLTQNELKARGVKSPATIAKGKRRLVELGFLDVIETGTVNKPTLFQVSDRWRKYPRGDYKPQDGKPPGVSLYDGLKDPEHPINRKRRKN